MRGYLPKYMKLAVVVSVLNQHELATTCIDFVQAYSSQDTDIVIIDNASDPVFDYNITNLKDNRNIKIIRQEKNIGVYPIFWEALKYTDADVIAYFHSDLMFCEKGWDERVLACFEMYEKLGLIGFVGSDEIDANGGRGLGTTSNFKGYKHMHQDAKGNKKEWIGSEGKLHGAVNQGFTKAAVVDGCAMIFRRKVLEQIKPRGNFPPHHFYDRVLSCEVQEAGYEVGVLGIGCDHISGQSVNGSLAYEQMAEIWAGQHGVRRGFGDTNWDIVLYREAERQFMEEYRDQKKFIPRKV